MLEMAEAGGDCYPLDRETFPIAQMKRESGSGTFERSDSLVLQIGCKWLLEGQAICTKLLEVYISNDVAQACAQGIVSYVVTRKR
jgi:hypothetical protein